MLKKNFSTAVYACGLLSLLLFFCTEIVRDSEFDPNNPDYIKNSISIVIDTSGIDSLTTETPILIGIKSLELAVIQRVQEIIFTFAPSVEISKIADTSAGFTEIWLDSTYRYKTVGEKTIYLYIKTVNGDDIYDSVNVLIVGSPATFTNKIVVAPTEAIYEDTTITLSVAGQAIGTDTLKYQWYKDTTNEDSLWSYAIEDQIYENFMLTSLTLNDSGNYFCVVSNLFGSDTSNKAFLDIMLVPVDSNAPVVYFTEAKKSGSENVNGTIALALSKQSDEEVSVVCQLSTSSTATKVDDHSFVDYKVVFSSGEVIKSIPIVVMDDNLKESMENVILSLTTPRKCRLHNDSINEFTYEIIDNDESFVGFSSPSFSANENTTGTIRDSIPLILSALNNIPVTVDIAVVPGNPPAVEGADFKIIGTKTVTFPAMKDTAYVALDIYDDTLIEGDESISFALINPTGGLSISSADSLCSYTIRDNDIVTIAFSEIQATSIGEEAEIVKLSVTLSKKSEKAVTVNYQSVDGTAKGNGVDYALLDTAKLITFEPGILQKDITISIINDIDYEGDESFSIELVNPSTNAMLGNSYSATVSIIDNEKISAVFSEPILEGTESILKVLVPVSLSARALKDVSVDFVPLLNSTATIDVDYSIVTQSPLTFVKGDTTTTKYIEISVVNDKQDEVSEAVFIKLDKPSNVTLGADSLFTYTILDDDYTVKVISSGNGSVTPIDPQVVSSGDSISITATAATNYHFLNWTQQNSTLSLKSTVLPATVITAINDSGTVTANFGIDSFAVTVNSDENGSVGIGASEKVVPYGGTLSFSTVTANTNYVFDKWILTGGITIGAAEDSVNVNALFTVTGAGTIKATFKLREYDIEVLKVGNGTLDKNGIIKVPHGSSLTITAKADTNYHLIKWVSDSLAIVGAANELTKTLENITKNGTITAHFAIDTHTVTINAGANGSVISGGGDQIIKYVAHGDSINIESYADAHYHFLSWSNQDSLEIVNTSAAVTKIGNVKKDATLIANFEVDSHAVYIGVKTGQSIMGSTAPTGVSYYDYGQVVDVAANVNNGYLFTFWEIGSGGTSTDNPYQLTVNGDDSLIANFEGIKCTLSVASSTLGSVPYSTIIVPYDTDTVITVTAERGCQFGSWTNPDGFTISDLGNGRHRISAITKKGSLTANFSIIPAVSGVVYVDKNANGNGAKDGTSWYNAYSSFTKALDSTLVGKTFWVAKGTYKPIDEMNDPSNRGLKFTLQSGDTILGGFSGFDIAVPLRDSIVHNTTILSGDIMDENDISDNSGLIIRTNSNVIIKNFTIQDAGDQTKNGNGFDIWGNNTLIENCVIHKISGSGIKINAHDVHIKNCVFIENNAGEGAGIYMYSAMFDSWKNIVIENSVFANNETSGGGAIYANASTDCVKYVNCTIVNNVCTGNYPAGLYNGGNDTLINCIFYGNSVVNSGYVGTQIYRTNLLYYCNVQDASSTGIKNIMPNSDKGGNIETAPDFTGEDFTLNALRGSDGLWFTADDGLHLKNVSPCKNTGVNPYPHGCQLPVGDILGNSRTVDGRVDIGAYEQ